MEGHDSRQITVPAKIVRSDPGSKANLAIMREHGDPEIQVLVIKTGDEFGGRK